MICLIDIGRCYIKKIGYQECDADADNSDSFIALTHEELELVILIMQTKASYFDIATLLSAASNVSAEPLEHLVKKLNAVGIHFLYREDDRYIIDKRVMIIERGENQNGGPAHIQFLVRLLRWIKSLVN